MHKNIYFLVLTMVAVGMFFPELVDAAVKLPSWAPQGDLASKWEGVGKKIVDLLSILVGILGVIGLMVGAACFPLNKADLGKQFVLWSGVGLVVAGSAYGIAAVFLS